MKEEIIKYDMTWEELEEQQEANERKENMKNYKPRVRKYV